MRCDDNDIYKSHTRSEIREWIKKNTASAQSTKKASTAENHDAFEWMIVHVVIRTRSQLLNLAPPRPPTGQAQMSARLRRAGEGLLDPPGEDEVRLQRKRKTAPDRVAQIRIGINDVPYDVLPRVVPAVPSGYSETGVDAENAWQDLVAKMKDLILSSFDMRVSQYEEDIREKDSQRSLPGWNFCTFFILKEGLARGFESVGLVEDALVGYDELSVGSTASSRRGRGWLCRDACRCPVELH